MGDNVRVTQGKRAGARPKPRLRPRLLLLALGVTAAVVAWGYLVSAAIDFGTQARDGEPAAWAFLALAAVGAVMCLFLGLALAVRAVRTLGSDPTPATDSPITPEGPGTPPTDPPRPPGGRRAAR
jgi:fatty acid desaturase